MAVTDFLHCSGDNSDSLEFRTHSPDSGFIFLYLFFFLFHVRGRYGLVCKFRITLPLGSMKRNPSRPLILMWNMCVLGSDVLIERAKRRARPSRFVSRPGVSDRYHFGYVNNALANGSGTNSEGNSSLFCCFLCFALFFCSCFKATSGNAPLL